MFDASKMYDSHGVLRKQQFVRHILKVVSLDDILREMGILSLANTLEFLNLTSILQHAFPTIISKCLDKSSADPLLRVLSDLMVDRRDRSDVMDLEISECLDIDDNRHEVGEGS